MLWIPYIPLIVFLLTLVPAFYYGFKIGWRASLFISLTTFLLVAIAVLIFYFAYEAIVWPWWKTIYISGDIKPGSGISVGLFKEIASIKKMGVLFASGCFAPIAMLISWGVYRSVRRPLNKYLGHKTNEVQDVQNHKNIISLKNRKPSKIIGGVILITNTTLIAGMLTSTANIIVMPRANRNTFSKITDGIGGIYGIGLGKNNEEGRVIHEFISKLDSKITRSISEFTNISDKDKDKNEDFLNVDKLRDLITQKLIFDELFKNENASYELFKAITKNINHIINPLMFFKSIVSDDLEHGNQVGYNINDEFYTLNDAQKWFKENTNLIDSMNFPQRVKKLFLDVINRSFEDFNVSVFYENVELAKSTLSDAKTELENYKQDLKNLLSSNKNDSDKRADLIQSLIPNLYGMQNDMPNFRYKGYDISDVMANGITTDINYEFKNNTNISKTKTEIDGWFESSEISKNPNRIKLKSGYSDTSLTNTNKGVVFNMFKNYKASKIQQEYDIAVLTHYQNVLTVYADTTWRNAFSKLNSEKEKTNQIINILNIFKKDLDDFKNRKKSAEQQLESNREKLATTEKDITELSVSSIPTKEQQKNAASNRVGEARAKLDNLESEKNSKKDSLDNAQQNYDNGNDNKNDLENSLNSEEKKLKDKSSELVKITNEISDLESVKLNKKNQISEKNVEINSIVRTINELRNSENDEASKITELESKKQNLEDEKVKLEEELRHTETNISSKIAEKNQINQEKQNITSNVNDLKERVKRAADDLKSLNSTLQRAKESYEDVSGRYSSADSNLNAASRSFNNIKQELDNLEYELSTKRDTKSQLEAQISNEEDEISELNSRIESKSQDIRGKENDLRNQRISQGNAQRDFDEKNRVKISMEKERDAKLSIKKNSVDRANTSWKNLETNMNQLDSYLNELTKLNVSLKVQEESYETLMTKDSKLKDRADATGLEGKTNTSNLSFYNFRKDGDDTGAIYYHEQHIRFLNSKIAQLEKIRNEREDQYHEARSRIIKMYQDWLNI